MTRTLLVALQVDSLDDLQAFADEVAEDLSSAGYDVDSVVPWGAGSGQVNLAPLPTTPILNTSPVDLTSPPIL